MLFVCFWPVLVLALIGAFPLSDRFVSIPKRDKKKYEKSIYLDLIVG